MSSDSMHSLVMEITGLFCQVLARYENAQHWYQGAHQHHRAHQQHAPNQRHTPYQQQGQNNVTQPAAGGGAHFETIGYNTRNVGYNPKNVDGPGGNQPQASDLVYRPSQDHVTLSDLVYHPDQQDTNPPISV